MSDLAEIQSPDNAPQSNMEAAAPEYPLTLSISKTVLINALSKLQSVVERRNTIAILANIKLVAENNQLEITATDMDIVATEKINANVGQEGALTVPAQTFYDICRKLPDDVTINLDTDTASKQLIVQAGKAKFKLSYLPAAEFPVLAEGDLSHHFTMPIGQWLDVLDRSRFAMSTEETRYYLNGVYLHNAESNGNAVLRAVSTDGHRLARVETMLPEGAAGIPSVIIPRKTVNEMCKLLEGRDGDITVSLSSSKVRFQAGDLILLSKLVDGSFPDYERVIPEHNNFAMLASADEMKKSVDLVATIVSDKSKGITFKVSENQLVLSAQSTDQGSAKEELDVQYTGDAIDIGFNSRYVLDMMSQLHGDEVQFLFKDSGAPTLVTDPADDSALYVIMPMRV